LIERWLHGGTRAREASRQFGDTRAKYDVAFYPISSSTDALQLIILPGFDNYGFSLHQGLAN